MNKEIEALLKREKRAQEIAKAKDANELAWRKAYAAARLTPEWDEFTQQAGISESYTYGDIIC